MPRQAGLDAAGTMHYVMVRGIEKRKVADDGRDRQALRALRRTDNPIFVRDSDQRLWASEDLPAPRRAL